jgi:arylsulfatase A-like enzyme
MKTGVIGGRFSINMLPDLQSGKLTLKPYEVDYVKALYDGDLRTTDRYVGELVDHLKQLALLDRTLIVVTSDHGEELGEHFPSNIGDHGHSLHEELLHVPLVLRDPLHTYPVKRVTPVVRTIDVLPTMADLLRVEIDHPLEGQSLVPFLEGKETEDRPLLAGWNRKGVLRFALRDGGFKLMHDTGTAAKRPLLDPPPAEQLFDLRHDPGELEDLTKTKTARAGAMRDALEQHLRDLGQRSGSPETEIDRKLRERLDSLGYK